MLAVCRRRIGAVAVACVALWGCSSDSPAPTPTPLSITCPPGQTLDSADGDPVTVTFAAPVVSGGRAPVTTTCLPTSGSPFAVGNTPVVCQAADSAGRATSCTFNVTVRPPPRLQYTQMTAFGDSITEGKASEPLDAGTALFRELSRYGPERAVQAFYQAPEPYPQGVQRRLRAEYVQQIFTVYNAGLGGEKAAEARTRFRTVLLETRPEVVLLMEGSNDLLSAGGADAAIDALDDMVAEALSQGRQVCLATIAPQRANGLADRGAVAARVPPFNVRVRALAAARGVVLVDVYDAMKDRVDELIGIDDLHPTEEGYAVMADTFVAAIRANFEEKPAAARASRTAR